MNNSKSDRLLLLLSTDWFFPYWTSIGLYIDRTNKQKIVCALRDEVRKTFIGRTYWRADFDAGRLAVTRHALLGAFENSAGVDAKHRLLSLIAQENDAVNESSRETWLLSMMTEMLVDSGEDFLTLDMRNAVRSIWNLSQTGSKDWHELCANADTEWDRSVRDLTPDLPCWLADFVAMDIECVDQFGIFWSDFVLLASEDEICKLKDWYRTNAFALTGENIELTTL